MPDRKIRVLIAKPGLDGHDRVAMASLSMLCFEPVVAEGNP